MDGESEDRCTVVVQGGRRILGGDQAGAKAKMTSRI
jgi:hypothetical protein